jgi:aspartate ammonia-lyase
MSTPHATSSAAEATPPSGGRDAGATRVEKDPLGEFPVPADALYGVQTARALENFVISGRQIHPLFVTTYAEVKQAAAVANVETGSLTPEKGDAIARAASEIVDGRWREQFRLDVFQAGAGTSYNMNLNEVIANRALELLGAPRGDYERIDPNDDVNKSQSTNDTMPTVMRITALRLARALCDALDGLTEAFSGKAVEFRDVRKAGRTHLHDATPITLGDECRAYAGTIRRATERIRAMEASLLEVPLGGTALGNGVNASDEYRDRVVAHCARITGEPVRAADDRVQLTQSLGDFVALSAAVRGVAIELSKIANDLRLLNSGPHTGLAEIELPATQPGSSIMPGKVNPAMAEMLNMICLHVRGLDTAVALGAEAGQLELNVMMPYVAYALFESLEVFAAAVRTFDTKCVRVIKAHSDRCAEFAQRSVGLAALHNEELGFMGAAELAEEAVDTGKTVDEILASRRR